MQECLIGLGANLGNRAEQLRDALQQIAAIPQTELLQTSPFLETAPIGGPPGQGLFLNAAATLQTALSAEVLLKNLWEIELRAGRQRRQHWAARQLDLDLLLFGQQIIRSEQLTVPHPRMAFRRFVLEPAAHVASHWRHPQIGWTIGELLAHLEQALPVVAVAASPGVRPRRFVDQLAEQVAEQLATLGLEVRIVAAPPGWEQLKEPWRLTDAGPQLTALAAAAAEAACPPAAGQLLISDWWFDELIVTAMVLLDSSELATFQARCNALGATVAPPKLLMLLDPEPNLVAVEHPSSTIADYAGGSPRLDQKKPMHQPLSRHEVSGVTESQGVTKSQDKGPIWGCPPRDPCQRRLSEEARFRLREHVTTQGVGPFLELGGDQSPEAALEQAVAAILAMI